MSSLKPMMKPRWLLLVVTVGAALFLAPLLGSRLWGPIETLEGQRRLSIDSQLSQADLQYCLLKDWGNRLSLQPSRSPNATSTVRLHNPVSGIVVDLVQRGDRREVVAYAPMPTQLTPSRTAAITDCAEGLQKAFGAADDHLEESQTR